jgi:hypothetical protein
VLRWPRTWRAYSVSKSAKTGGWTLSHWGVAGRPFRTCFAASRLASHLSALIPPNQHATASVIQSKVERRNWGRGIWTIIGVWSTCTMLTQSRAPQPK